MANPLYGQNKLDDKLGILADALPNGLSVSAHKALSFDIAVETTGNAQNADTGYDIPAGSILVGAWIINTGAVALASNAATLDVGGQDLTASISGLGAGAVKGDAAIDNQYFDTATSILVDGSSGIVTGSGSTTLKVIVHYIDVSAVSVL